MVIFDLICDSQHEFEGWFKNSKELVDQQKNGTLTCPLCDSGHVSKQISAPKVGKKSNSSALSKPSKKKLDNSEYEPLRSTSVTGDSSAIKNEAFGHLQDMLKKVHDYVESNFKDVGNRFVQEAISMHKGEKESANIRGTASVDQLQELADERVTALPLPDKPIDKKKLN